MHPEQLSDEILVARVAQGDSTALETLYDRHASTVLGIALRIIDERAAAEGILQETFWRIWQNAAAHQPQRGTFTTWLFSIARNLAIDAYHRQSVRPQPIIEIEHTDPVLDRMPDPRMNVTKQAQSNAIAKQAREALKSLPPEQKQVIEMAYFYGMTRQEIAEAIGEPIGTIHTRARLGLQKLRQLLERSSFEP
jgi:RNA polymerase sigma-70 factor (ECF subfamily)